MSVNAFRTTSLQKKSRKAQPVPVEETLEETAMKVFKQITDAWGFDEEQKIATLGLKNAAQLKNLQENPNSLTEKQMIKISYILNIFRALRGMLADEESADNWLKHTHEHRGILLKDDKTPLQGVLSGNTNDLKELCNCLAEYRTF